MERTLNINIFFNIFNKILKIKQWFTWFMLNEITFWLVNKELHNKLSNCQIKPKRTCKCFDFTVEKYIIYKLLLNVVTRNTQNTVWVPLTC